MTTEIMKVLYEGSEVDGEIREDGVYVFDEAICGMVRLGNVDQCKSEFAELN